MNLATDNPEMADDLAQAAEPTPYTIEGYRATIKRKDRELARLRNLIRLAETFSTEARVKKILEEAIEEQR